MESAHSLHCAALDSSLRQPCFRRHRRNGSTASATKRTGIESGKSCHSCRRRNSRGRASTTLAVTAAVMLTASTRLHRASQTRPQDESNRRPEGCLTAKELREARISDADRCLSLSNGNEVNGFDIGNLLGQPIRPADSQILQLRTQGASTIGTTSDSKLSSTAD
jgi:hypothetical protein